jgi:hypothetical protein
MASMTFCDICNKMVAKGTGGYRTITVSDNQKNLQVFDAHDRCVAAMKQWMTERREKSGKFKSIEEMRAGK